MSSPWRIDLREFTPEARRFLSAIRRGRSFEEAAARARIDEHQPRTWLRDPRFQEAYSRARERKSTARIINLDTLGVEDGERNLLRRRRDAGHASPEDLQRLTQLETD